MSDFVFVIAVFWFGLVLGATAGYFLRPASGRRWRESAEFRKHMGEPFGVNERT